MPIKKVTVQSCLAAAKAGLADRLAQELKCPKEYGQPTIYEQEYATKKVRGDGDLGRLGR